MVLKITNTLTRKKDEFKPRIGKKVQLFVCGPTVYDYSHIGHARTSAAFDTIVKYLKYEGYDVFYLQNITDIDDKIIARAKESGEDALKLAHRFEKEYYEDMKRLNVTSVNKYARATDYIKQIVQQVQTLMKKGVAYRLDDGIYYNIESFKDYGKLSGRSALAAEDATSRIDESIFKKNKGDFCLWKFHKEGEPFWETALGKGRPGWHIEDTAITEAEFGPQYDMHGGGRDLIFPHHEAEIAQMEAASGKKPLVRYWLHTGFLNVEGQKMSKSLGNFITIRDALAKWDKDALRFMFASTHYKSAIDYSEASLEQAASNVEKIRKSLENASRKGDSKVWIKKFEDMMDDDFNTPQVVALLLEMAKHANKTGEDISEAVYEMGVVLGVDFKPKKQKSLSASLKKLISEREQARKAKDWAKSDKIRAELAKEGVIISDTAEGPNWRWA